MVSAASVEVLEGLREEFFHRHRKDTTRAKQVWKGLVQCGTILKTTPHAGTQVPKNRFPARFHAHQNLWKVDLPHAFRALYTVVGSHHGVRVVIEWIGDHGEYDRLFGYR